MKFYSVICVIVKNENEYIEEWVDHHFKIGVDHIVIYDNNSTLPFHDILKKYLDSGKVEIRKCGITRMPQLKAYNHCLYDLHQNSFWIGFIDIDEFIVLHKHKNINAFLHEYEAFGGICLNWKVFDANGHIKRPHGSVMEAYLTALETAEKINMHIKTFLQPKYTVSMVDVHSARYIDGYYGVNENKNRVNGAFSKYSGSVSTIHHYYTKSYEEWVNKIIRGRADMILTSKHEGEFWKINSHMVKYKESARRRFLYPHLLKIPHSSFSVKRPINWVPILTSNSRYNDALGYLAKILANSIQHLSNNGLFNGRIGILLYLFNYAEYKNNEQLYDFAFNKLNAICKSSFAKPKNYGDVDLSFSDGLAGIGWAIQYLYESDLIDVDIDSIFTNMEPVFRSINVSNMLDYSLPKGWIGYGMYLLARIDSSVLAERTFLKERQIIEKIILYLSNSINYISQSKYLPNEYSLFDISTVVPFLIKAYNSNINRKMTIKVIRQYLEGLRKKYKDPATVELNSEKDATQVLLNLLFANNLINIAGAFKMKSLSLLALRIINTNALHADDCIFSSIRDLAMASHLYNHFYQQYKKEVFKEISYRMTYKIIDGIESLKKQEGDLLSPDICSFSSGLSFVGLVLMAKVSPREPLWESGLLIN